MIAVAGGKGGCGKTTTTACLGRALADAGAEPVVVDVDVDMPDLHAVAGATLEPGLDALASGAAVRDLTQSALQLSGVRVIPGGAQPPTDLSGGLARLRTVRGPVLLDTAAGASPTVADPLRAADATILVSTPTSASLADAAKTAAMARSLSAPPIGVVLVSSDGSIDARPLLECPVLAHVPDVERPLADERVRDAYANVTRSLPKRNI